MPTAIITGANRGLGLEFVRQYAANGWRVFALCRTAADNQALAELANIEVHQVDVADFSQIDAFAANIKDVPVDLLINNAGVFGPKAKADGDYRQSFGQMDYDIWSHLLRVNTMAPLKLAESLHQNLLVGQQKKIVTLSSSIASISDTETGVFAYRSSKAAVNMVMATLANELRDDSIAIGLFCPGWVNTRMGGEAAPISPKESIAGMRALIDEMSLENSGQFVRFDRKVIPW